MDTIKKVQSELRKYVHPVLDFSVRNNEGVTELVIDLKNKPPDVHTYYLPIHPRDLELRAAALAEQKSFDQAAKIAASLIQHYQQTGNMLRVRIMHQRNQAYQKGRALYWENGSQAN